MVYSNLNKMIDNKEIWFMSKKSKPFHTSNKKKKYDKFKYTFKTKITYYTREHWYCFKRKHLTFQNLLVT